jgi:hypothetical protein
MTYSVLNLKVDNEIQFAPGVTAGYVLSINGDGTTAWVEAQGGGGGLTVDFTGLPTDVYLGETLALTASTTQSFSVYDVDNDLPNRVSGFPNRYIISNTASFYYSKRGTQSVRLYQSDFTNTGIETKVINVTQKPNTTIVYACGTPINSSYIKNNTSISYKNYYSILYGSNGAYLQGTNPGPTIALELFSVAVNNTTHEITYVSSRETGTNLSIWRYNVDNNLISSQVFNSTTNCLAVAMSPDGNIFYGGNHFNFTIRKATPSGTNLWTAVHGADVRGLISDSAGNLYMTGNRTVSIPSTRKFNSSGGLLWSADHGANTLAIAIDKNNDVIVVGFATGGFTTRKYDTNGNLLWSANHGNTCRGVACDGNNNVFTVGTSFDLRKYDANGNLLATVDTGQPETYSVAVDADGNIYVGGNPGNVVKLSPALNILWTSGAAVGIIFHLDLYPSNKGFYLV